MLAAGSLSAQRLRKKLVLDTTVVQAVSAGGSIQFKREKKIKPQEMVTRYKQSLQLSPLDEMRLQGTEKSPDGSVHYRYKQYYKNIPVESATFLIHAANDIAETANGTILSFEAEADTTPAVAAQQAIAIALQNSKASVYYWQDETKEAKAKQKGKSYYPNPELCFYKNSDSSLALCYRLYVYAVRPQQALQYFINARNGNIEKIKNLQHNCGHYAKEYAPGPMAELNCAFSTVTSPWDGLKTVYAVYNSDNPTYPYRSIDNCTPAVITVMDSLGTAGATAPNTNNWDVALPGRPAWQNRGTGVIGWTLRQCANYYYARFNRQSYGHDNDNGDIDAYFPVTFQRPDGSYYSTNASYSYDAFGNDELKFGFGVGAQVTDCFIPPDITGHEYTHGVTEYRADFDYEAESGALDESYSDIFGEAVERYIRGDCDYLVGNEITAGSNSGGPLYFRNSVRSLINPQDTGWRIEQQPDRYKGTGWKPTTNLDDDHGGVHRNSGVQNYMFYLLTNGGNGYTNNATSHGVDGAHIGFRYEVAGIGFDKAIAIAYASQNYLTETSGYAEARNAWVQAAVALYGTCSYEAIQTGKAWNAVGLPPPGTNAEQVCTVTYNNGFYYSLGSFAYVLSSTTYMDVAGPVCDANVSATGYLVTMQAQGDIIFKPGFTAPEGTNIVANNEVDECRYAAF